MSVSDLTQSAPPVRGRPRAHLERGKPLDEAVARTLTTDAPWARAAVAPIVAVLSLAVLIPVVVIATGLPRHGDGTGAYSLIGELLLGVVVLLAARPLAVRYDGWTSAVGLGRPVRGDGKRVAVWFLAQLGVRFCVAFVLAIAVPHLPHVGNLTGTKQLGAAGITMLLLAGVVVAPVVEELAFRGMLLRALMRRLPYWPAAGLSSLVFAALHAPTARSWTGAVAIVLFIYAFGLVQCQLVRRTARLAPAMGVHAVSNLLTIVAALAAG